MRAKIKGFLLCAVFIAFSEQVHAAENSSQNQPTATDTCMVLAHYDFGKTVQALTTFRTDVFGKNPERWTVEDVNNLIANVTACDGKPLNVQLTFRVSAGNWKRALTSSAMQTFLQVANRSTQIGAEFEPIWPKKMRMPYCADLLKWSRDPIWLTNNAEEIFGNPFFDLDAESGVIIAKYVDACFPILTEILKSRQLDYRLAGKFVDDIKESIKRDQSATLWNEVELEPRLRLTKDGKPIPLAYLSRSTRDIVIKINNALKNNILLDTDTLAQISTWIGDMNKANTKGPDALYVDEIKKIVNDQLFKQEQKFDSKP